MPKVLYISNLSGEKHSLGFSGSAMYALKNLGYEFHYVANRSQSSREQTWADQKQYGIFLHHIDLSRSPYSLQNIKAYKQLCKLIKELDIDYIHCNTPVGGLLGRLAGKKCGVKKVIYQAHGFHFYKGAPRLNWLVYYPIEKILAKYTDALITINTEDFELAKKKFKLRNNGEIYYVSGVGIDASRFADIEIDIQQKRNQIGVEAEDCVFISAGRLDVNKNNQTAIKALSLVSGAKLIVCGDGVQMELLKKLAAELNVQDRIIFLGNRSDIPELFTASDAFVMLSFREGLSRSIMEAMSTPLPCLVSKIRGNVDLVDENGGFLVNPTDVEEVAEAMQKIADDKTLCEQMKAYNSQKIKNFELSQVIERLEQIYKTQFGEGFDK